MKGAQGRGQVGDVWVLRLVKGQSVVGGKGLERRLGWPRLGQMEKPLGEVTFDQRPVTWEAC